MDRPAAVVVLWESSMDCGPDICAVDLAIDADSAVNCGAAVVVGPDADLDPGLDRPGLGVAPGPESGVFVAEVFVAAVFPAALVPTFVLVPADFLAAVPAASALGFASELVAGRLDCPVLVAAVLVAPVLVAALVGPGLTPVSVDPVLVAVALLAAVLVGAVLPAAAFVAAVFLAALFFGAPCSAAVFCAVFWVAGFRDFVCCVARPAGDFFVTDLAVDFAGAVAADLARAGDRFAAEIAPDGSADEAGTDAGATDFVLRDARTCAAVLRFAGCPLDARRGRPPAGGSAESARRVPALPVTLAVIVEPPCGPRWDANEFHEQ